jgi:acyl-CoA hydrolase
MKKLVYLVLTFTLVESLLNVVACSKTEEKYAAIPQGATVLILGDSLSYGTGANAGTNTGEDYPSLLATKTGWQIINAGVPGDTSADGLVRLPALLQKHQPKLLIVELGGNDFLHNVSQTNTVANLKAILAEAKATAVPTVMVAIPELSAFRAAVGNLQDHALYEALAQETNTPLISNVFSEVLSDNTLKADQIHANAKGYAVVSELLYRKLAEFGFFKIRE